MSGITSDRLKQHRERILRRWEERAMVEVPSATAVTNLALRDSLPLYLNHLSNALAENRKMDRKAVAIHDAEAIRIGRLHGEDRATSASYVLTEVIFEYHILREVIFEALEIDGPLSQLERDIILDSIEQAVNDAVVKFSEIHADIQQKFINTLTHDLKTPISSAQLHAQIILKRSADPVTTKSASRILAGLQRLTHMIHDLLDASRVRAGEELALQFSECYLDVILREVTEEMIAIHGERFVLDSLTGIRGNWSADGLRRTVENLMSNAVKYSPPETPIEVTLQKLDTTVEIEVHNQGAPIAEADQAQLFNQFKRTKSATESHNTGWGIGLTLVKGVVDAHKGSVRVESALGQGTSFIVSLPASIS